MDYRETIIEIIRKDGPVLPSQISVKIGKDQLISSAMLSELADSKKLRISSLKIGGSPLYYLPEQHAQLERYVGTLNPKDQDTVEALKKETVLKDSVMEPLRRVSLRILKDFAVPIEVDFGKGKELFWKWSIATEEEVKSAITRKHLPVRAEAIKPEIKPETAKPVRAVQKTLGEQKQAKPKPGKPDTFMLRIKKYLESNRIEILDEAVVSKNKEINLTISVPGAIGRTKYYCKARNKKTISDGDISTAVLEGQKSRLPLLFLGAGKLSKKARALIEKGLDNVIVKEDV
ncbi:hypothetical protein J4475_03280 [Candidatus Woesearchaeota archaeon]|nr:hypothetical protein [Candidatus Woesearchaeota archaeon]